LESIAAILTAIVSMGPLLGLVVLLSVGLISVLVWLLKKVLPMLENIANSQTIISIAQEATATHLQRTGDTLNQLFDKINAHDKQAALVAQNQDQMHSTCEHHGEIIAETKDFFTGCHKEEMISLARIETKIDGLRA
jgi:hypothetical protein